MFEIILEMDGDKEKKIDSPVEWGGSAAEVANKLCEVLEEARNEDCTFVCINSVVVKVENVWGARVNPKVKKSEGDVISVPSWRS